MKKLLTILMLLIASTVLAQRNRLDTVYCRAITTPFLWPSFPQGTDTATYMVCVDHGGDNHNRESEYWAIVSQKGKVLKEGLYVIQGAEYATWDSNDNNDVYRIIGNSLQLSVRKNVEVYFLTRGNLH